MLGPGRNRTKWIVAVLVVLGLVVGLAVGLFLGWNVMPVKYVDTSFADLQPNYKEQFILLVGSAYAQDHDLAKAETRLDQLEAPNIRMWVSELADRFIAEGRDKEDVISLAGLADGLGVANYQMLAYLASPTPVPTNTPVPTPTPVPTDTPLPTDTPIPATDTATAAPPTETLPPTNTPKPAQVVAQVQPTATAKPATSTPKPAPKATSTPKPPTKTPKPPTSTPKPKPAAKWTIVEQRLVGPGQDSQGCTYGNLQVRVTVLDANGQQIGGVWVHDFNSGMDQVTGHKGADPYWGPGEAEFDYDKHGGGRLCITAGAGGTCESPQTRELPCYDPPPFEDVWAAGYCGCCGGEAATNKEVCRQIYDAHSEANNCVGWWGHYSWRVVFKRSF